MKRLSKLLMLVVACCLLVTACGGKDKEEEKEKTPAEKIVALFEENIKETKDVEQIANNINDSMADFVPYSTGVMPIATGDYVEGMNDGVEIKNFTEGAVIKPMIGAQPFIVYVFKSKDASALAKELEENANLRWNVCTSADEAKVKVVDDYVVFVMSEKSFEEE